MSFYSQGGLIVIGPGGGAVTNGGVNNGQDLTVTPPGGALTAFAAKSGNTPTLWDNGQDGPGVLNAGWQGAYPTTAATVANMQNQAAPFQALGSSTIGAPTPYTSCFCAGNHYTVNSASAGNQVALWNSYTVPALPFYSYRSYYRQHDPFYWYNLQGPPYTGQADNNCKLMTGGEGSSIYGANYWYAETWGGSSGSGPLSNTDTAEYAGNAGVPSILQSPDVNGNSLFWRSMPNPANPALGIYNGWQKVESVMCWTTASTGFYFEYVNNVATTGAGANNGYAGPTIDTSTTWTDAIGGYSRNQGPTGTQTPYTSANGNVAGEYTQWRYYGCNYYDRQNNLARFYVTNSATFTLGSGTLGEVQYYVNWSTGSVTLQVFKGNLSAGAAYVWYVDEANGHTTPVLCKSFVLN